MTEPREKNTAIRFPSDREFVEFRELVRQNYHTTEAVVERRQVTRTGETTAVLRTFGFGSEHDALATIAFRRHAGVIL